MHENPFLEPYLQNPMIKSPVTIIVSRTDDAGMNMKKHLVELDSYEKMALNVPETWPKGDYELLMSKSKALLTIPERQIHADYMKGYIETNLLIFASKHSSKAGMKAILVHSTGNWSEAWNNSGRGRSLGISHGQAMFRGYHSLKKQKELLELDEYWLGIECTHHGPTELDVPLLFMECGGTETEWNDVKATKAVSYAINEVADSFVDPKEDKLPTAIGIGGGHYCPAFVKRIDAKMFYLGHVAPKHHHDALDEEMVIKAWERTKAKEKFFLIDKKGTKGAKRQELIQIFEKHGYPWKLTTAYPTK